MIPRTWRVDDNHKDYRQSTQYIYRNKPLFHITYLYITNFLFKQLLFFNQFVEHRSLHSHKFGLLLVVELFKHHHRVPSLVQEAAREIQCLLWSNLPVAAEVHTIYKDNALAPLLHIEEGVAHFVKFKG